MLIYLNSFLFVKVSVKMFPIAAFEYYQNKNMMRIERRRLRDSLDPFDMPDNRFKEMYRLPRALAFDFFVELEAEMENQMPDIPLHLQFCAALNFYASGSYQRRVGSDAFAFMSQTSISNSIRSVSTHISTRMSSRYIRFPQTIHEFEELRQGFEELSDFPGVFALIDGTLVDLCALSHLIEHAYISRKGVTSINVQIICDSRKRILNINARYPGSTHDSFIWGSSLVYPFLEQMAQQLGNDWIYVMLGDAGYPLQPWLMKPYPNPATPEQELFNILHKNLRSLVERTIGLLKARFRCLNKERRLRYDPLISGHIIYSCAVLHNYLLDNNYPIDDIMPEPDEDDSNDNRDGSHHNHLQRGNAVREMITEYLSQHN